jgi:hypothetical protein
MVVMEVAQVGIVTALSNSYFGTVREAKNIVVTLLLLQRHKNETVILLPLQRQTNKIVVIASLLYKGRGTGYFITISSGK